MLSTLLALSLFATDPKVSISAEASADRINVGEPLTFNVTVTIEGQSDEAQYTPPDFDGLEVVRKGTQRGQSFVMNFGHAPKVQVTTTYTYVLQANRPGKAKIGAATVRLGRELQSTETLVVDVGGSASNNAQPQQKTPALPATPGGRTEPVMLRVVPDKFEAFIGEQVVLSVFLLSRVELTDIQSLSQPQLEGVLLERDDRPRTNLTPRIQRFGGEEYQVFEIQRYALFALRDGKATVGAFNLEAQGGLGFFSQGKSYRVASEPIEVQIKPLPSAGRPVGFSPMNVGQLEFSAQVLSGQGQVGKPLTLRMMVSGIGNLSKISLPSPRFGAKIKSYDPETKSEQRFEGGQLSGKIQRDYLFVPLEPGEHIIGPLVFSSFDPKTGQYREQTSQAFAVNVSGDATSANPIAASTKPQKDGQKPLHPIRPSSHLRDDRPSQATWMLVWAGSASSVLSALGIMFGRLRKREKSTQEIARGARAKAEKGLRTALAKGDPLEAYSEMHRVVRVYLSERFGISTGTGRDRLRAALITHGADERKVDALLVELDNCDFARFAPGGHQAREAAQSKQRMEAVISELDRTKGNT